MCGGIDTFEVLSDACAVTKAGKTGCERCGGNTSLVAEIDAINHELTVAY